MHIFLVIIGILLASCYHTRAQQAAPLPTNATLCNPMPLAPVSELGPDFVLHENINATFQDKSIAFKTVLEKKNDVLTLVAFTSFGTRAFVLQQTGITADVIESSTKLPVDPLYIFSDIHRVHFFKQGDDNIQESTDADGTLERTIQTQYCPAGLIKILYFRNKNITIDHARAGYRLEIIRIP